MVPAAVNGDGAALPLITAVLVAWLGSDNAALSSTPQHQPGLLLHRAAVRSFAELLSDYLQGGSLLCHCFL
jgi:hypothetical protein